MKKERNKAVPASYIILKKDGKILLGRRANSGYYDGWYGLPSGHVEAGELPIAAVIRETKEEVGITLQQEDVSLVHTLYREAHDETGNRADYFFTATKWDGDPIIMEPEKCDHLDWFLVNVLPENTMQYMKDVVLLTERGIRYSEIDKAHQIENPTKPS